MSKSTGWLSFSSVVEVGSGDAWQTPGDAITPYGDGLSAMANSSSIPYGGNCNTKVLLCKSIVGLSIPALAKILGVSIDLYKYGYQYGTYPGYSHSIYCQLYKNTTPAGSSKSSNYGDDADWVEIGFGGVADGWSANFTAADIAQIGVGIQVYQSIDMNGFGPHYGYVDIDAVKVNITYDEPNLFFVF